MIFPIVGATIGWCTNWLAVKMIFRPRRPRSFLGIRVQGLLPRRQSDLAESVAQTVEKDLISVELIQKTIQDLIEGGRVRDLLHQRVDALIDEQLKSFGPMMQAFVSEDLIATVKSKIEQEVLSFVRTLSGQLRTDLAQHIDIHEMVRSKIEGFEISQLEKIVFRIAAKEFRHIEFLGGVLGFFIGVAQAGLVWSIES